MSSCLSKKTIILLSEIAFLSVKVVKNSIIFIILPNRASGVLMCCMGILAVFS